MKQSNRLILNTLATYARMVVTVGIGLTTMRLQMSTLGESDFGLFFALGGGLSFIMLVSTALAASAQRHLAYEIGRKDDTALREVFCTSVVIYLVLGLLIAVLGIALRPAFIYGLTIPEDRLTAAKWVYDLCLLNMALSVLMTPYTAVFVARQAIVQDSIFGVFIAVAGLLAIFFTPYVHADFLIGYAILVSCSYLLIMSLQIIRGLWLFPETHFRFGLVRRHRVRELVGFAGWSFLSTVAWQCRTQGSQLILNLFFGPVVNASYAVANQASTYMNNFSASIGSSVRPAMNSAHGAGRRDHLDRLALSSSKLTVLASAVVAVPLILYPQAVLMLWLGRIPPYADSFIPVIMIWSLVIHLTLGHNLALMALNEIGKVTRYTLWLDLAPMVLAIGLFYFTNVNPIALMLMILVGVFLHTLVDVWYAGAIVGIKPHVWFQKVVVPCVLSIGINVAIALIATATIDNPTSKLVATVIVYLAVCPFVTWYVALNGEEKQKIMSFVHSFRSAVRGRMNVDDRMPRLP